MMKATNEGSSPSSSFTFLPTQPAGGGEGRHVCVCVTQGTRTESERTTHKACCYQLPCSRASASQL